jgi:hypothetical protein
MCAQESVQRRELLVRGNGLIHCHFRRHSVYVVEPDHPSKHNRHLLVRHVLSYAERSSHTKSCEGGVTFLLAGSSALRVLFFFL